MLDISAHLFQLQAASSRVPVSPPLFWLSLHRLGSRAVVTCILLHPSSPTGGRSSWWGISASQLAISALLVPLQLAPDIKNFLFPGGSDGKESACNAGDGGLIPGLGRSPGECNGNPLQYSCLETPMDRGAWWAAVPGVAQSWTRLTRLSSSSNSYLCISDKVWLKTGVIICFCKLIFLHLVCTKCCSRSFMSNVPQLGSKLALLLLFVDSFD